MDVKLEIPIQINGLTATVRQWFAFYDLDESAPWIAAASITDLHRYIDSEIDRLLIEAAS